MAHQMLYRWGFAVELVYCVSDIPLTVIFYSDQGRESHVALMMVVLDIDMNTIESIGLLGQFAGLLLLSGGHHGAHLPRNDPGFVISLHPTIRTWLRHLPGIFRIRLLRHGLLIYRSTFMPRMISALLAIEGVGCLVDSFWLFLVPAFQPHIFSYFAPTAIAEIALCFRFS